METFRVFPSRRKINFFTFWSIGTDCALRGVHPGRVDWLFRRLGLSTGGQHLMSTGSLYIRSIFSVASWVAPSFPNLEAMIVVEN